MIIFGNQEQLETYLYEMRGKVINNPKFLRFEWMKQEKLNDVRRTLKHQKTREVFKLDYNIYRDLVWVFFTNLTFEGDFMSTHIKRVDMDITSTVQTTITGLKNTEGKVRKGNTKSLEDYHKIQFSRSCLRNSSCCNERISCWWTCNEPKNPGFSSGMAVDP